VSSHKAVELAALPTDGPRTWPVFGLMVLLSAVASAVPARVAFFFADALGLLVGVVAVLRDDRAARRRRGVGRNLRIVFGRQQSPAALRRRTLAYGRHGGRLFVEALRMKRLDPLRIRRHVDMTAFTPIRALLAEGNGVIVATGHLGNWETFAVAAGRDGFDVTSLARPLPEPGLMRWLARERERSGARVLNKFGGLWALKKVLDRGEVVGLNVDENVREGGLFVPFAGVLAATNASAARLQRITGAPIAVMTCNRLDVERFVIRLWAVIRPDPAAEKEAEALRVTAAVAAGLERALRAYPEQWLWGLRRFETRPEGEPPLGPDGLPPPI
jgi:KDO2-lipid IV(A) lauroyltransferase